MTEQFYKVCPECLGVGWSLDCGDTRQECMACSGTGYIKADPIVGERRTDIENAPRDGTWILIESEQAITWGPNGNRHPMYVVAWREEGFHDPGMIGVSKRIFKYWEIVGTGLIHYDKGIRAFATLNLPKDWKPED